MQEQTGEDYEAFAGHARLADIFFLAHVTGGPAVDLLPQLTASAPTVVVFDSSPRLQALARLGGTPVAQPRRARAHQDPTKCIALLHSLWHFATCMQAAMYYAYMHATSCHVKFLEASACKYRILHIVMNARPVLQFTCCLCSQ